MKWPVFLKGKESSKFILLVILLHSTLLCSWGYLCLLYLSICWSYTPIGYNCTSLPKYKVSDIPLVAWNWPWWKYSHYRNGPIPSRKLVIKHLPEDNYDLSHVLTIWYISYLWIICLLFSPQWNVSLPRARALSFFVVRSYIPQTLEECQAQRRYSINIFAWRCSALLLYAEWM